MIGDDQIPNQQNAVSVYSQDGGMNDFPVLKAFQQYIDEEHAKARKRLIGLGIFFSILMGAVIAIFVTLLLLASNRNQVLNDRLIEFAMRDRDRGTSGPVVVQPPVQQDNSALVALTAKLESMQKQMAEAQEKAAKAEAAEKARREAEAAAQAIAQAKAEAEAAAARAAENAKLEAERKKAKEELEILKLKAQLAQEKEKLAQEKERAREAELEAYRRKHYPELYGPKPSAKPTPSTAEKELIEREEEAIKKELAEQVDEDEAISYFDEDETKEPDKKPVKKNNNPPKVMKTEKSAAANENDSTYEYKIPVEIRGNSSTWVVPN